MGYITSVLIRYERIGKYHHNYVLFFCKDRDKTMNLILFCWILVCFNMFLVNICKRCYYLTTGALTSCARFFLMGFFVGIENFIYSCSCYSNDYTDKDDNDVVRHVSILPLYALSLLRKSTKKEERNI